MWAYTQEVRDFESLKRLIILSLQLNGYNVILNPNKKHKLFNGQEEYEAPMQTVVMKTEKEFINWHRLSKFFIDREDGYGKIHMPDDLLDDLIKELELRLLMKGVEENAR